MELSDDGVAFIVRWEGRRNRAYHDQLGHCTVGIGHLLHPGACTVDEQRRVWTDDEVDELFRSDVARYVEAVNRHVAVPLSQHQFDALVSFAFNWGIGQTAGFPATSVLALVNAGDFAGAAAELVDGVGPNGRPYDKGIEGVRLRRLAEAEMLRSGGRTVNLVTRSEWGARPPRATTPVDGRLRGVACHWEGPHMGWPWDHGECAGRVAGIQAFHMDSRGWNDIAYNAVVCGHGFVFEGRGPGVRSGANGDADVNATHYAVCYLGGEGDEFTEAARAGFNDAAEWLGMADGEWVGHRDLTSTACPGEAIYAWAHGGHPGAGTDEEDDLFTDDDRSRQEATYNNVKNLGERFFALLGDGNWENGADRAARAVMRIEALTSPGGGSIDLDALAEQVAKRVVSLSDADVERIAKAVADESYRRQKE